MSSLKGVDRLLRSRHCGGLVLFDITILSHIITSLSLLLALFCYMPLLGRGLFVLCTYSFKIEFLVRRGRGSSFQATHFSSVSQAYHKELSSRDSLNQMVISLTKNCLPIN